MKKKHIEKIVDMYINKTLKDCYAIDIILNDFPLMIASTTSKFSNPNFD